MGPKVIFSGYMKSVHLNLPSFTSVHAYENLEYVW